MDWNWFFSSLAQSSAAIVGIFAAFIITRIVSNQTDFDSKRSRLLELNATSDHLRDAFRDRSIEFINREQTSAFRKDYEELLEQNPDLEPNDAMPELDWPWFVPFDQLPEFLTSSKTSYDERKAREPKVSYMQRASELSSNIAYDVAARSIHSSRSNYLTQETDAAASLITEIRQHIRVCSLHKTLIVENPENSKIIRASIWGCALLFFFGVIFPLSFLRVAKDTNPMFESVTDWAMALWTIKGILLCIVSGIFFAILIFFFRTNGHMIYPATEMSKLEKNLELDDYSEFLTIRSQNILKRQELDSMIKR